MDRSHVVLAVCAASSLALAGCGSDRLDQDPEALLAQMEQAIQSPSGHLGPDSARAVLTGTASQSDVNALNGVSSQGAQNCASRSGDVAEMDVSCATGGQGSGTLRVKLQKGTAGAFIVMVDFQEVCATAQGKAVCVDGLMVSKTSPGSLLEEAADLTLTVDGAPRHLLFGMKESLSKSDLSVSLAAYDDAGQSFVLDAGAVGGTGSLTLRDADGSYMCTYDSAGAKGSCKGPKGTITW